MEDKPGTWGRVGATPRTKQVGCKIAIDEAVGQAGFEEVIVEDDAN